MNLNRRPVRQVKLIGGRVCLDFVNSVGGRAPDPSRRRNGPAPLAALDDKLGDYFDLLAWSRRTGLLTEPEAQALVRAAARDRKGAAAVFNRAIVLREAIYRICTAAIVAQQPPASDLGLLNQELSIAHGRLRLAAGKKNLVWQWTDIKKALDRMLWLIADSAAEMLTTGDLYRLKQCPGDDCGWLFEDTSKNRRRQWCDMQDCGNLAKVRRFRSRLRRASNQ
jgi:predicted RNA-binding Zn ribbon-like protein